MSVLSAQSIRKLGIFKPFNERTIHNGMSYGLSSAGYDVRIAEDVTLSTGGAKTGAEILIEWDRFQRQFGDVPVADFSYEPHHLSFSLASTIERFVMPDDCIAYVKDKSSWARQGLSVFNTIIEPGWDGFLTLELVYHGNGTLNIAAGSPIAQIVFHKLDMPTEQPYVGKYQNQSAGAQPAILEKP